MNSPRRSIRAHINAPDGGWGWLVLAGAFVVFFVCDGVENSFGLLAAEIIQKLRTSRQTVGWIVSLKCACMFFVCPLSAVLCRSVDVRIVGAVAGGFAFLGFFSASFASVPWHLFITIGFVTGPGVGTCFLICTVTICTYFDRLRATATGIALCGSGFGGLALSPLVAILIGIYGWQGTMLLMSAVYLHTVPSLLLMRPLDAPPVQQQLQQQQQQQEQRTSTSEGPVIDGDSPASASALPSADHNTAPNDVKADDEVAAKVNEERVSLRNACWMADSLLAPITFLPLRAVLCFPPTAEHNSSSVSAICQRPTRCRNPCLLAFHASRLLLSAAAPGFFAYTADRCLQLGFSKSKSASLLAILSSCSMVGRLGFGCLGDRSPVSPLALYGLALLSGGSLVGVSLVAKDFGTLAACLGIAWGFVGGAISLTTLVTVHLDGTSRLFFVFARQSIFQGVGVLIGPPLAGTIFDRTGNYNATFAFIAACISTSALLVLGIDVARRIFRSRTALRNSVIA